MALPEISNEQKLTYIYHTLKDQESRHKHAIWRRVFKWLMLLGLIYAVITYPTLIFSKITEFVRPIIVEQATLIFNDNKTTILEGLSTILKTIRDVTEPVMAPTPEIIPEVASVIVPATKTPIPSTKAKTKVYPKKTSPL